ncbi:MAG TPA: iron-sulfur cluster repair di-iron protein [Vicinamibacterales bacterium]|nr:iron-sulfur cluster repair di-iron protein [Vicinamibacterales bacterium]
MKTTTPSLPQLPDMTLADIVTGDARTAVVFERSGLDYCCHGHQTLREAATDRGVPLSELVDQLASLGPRPDAAGAPAATNDLAALANYVVDRHHRYVRETIPTISAWLEKLVARHSTRHAELAAIQLAFEELASELLSHMSKEEHLLFPYISALAAAEKAGAPLPSSPFGTILNPIRVMEEDHRDAGDHMSRIRLWSQSYDPPPDACRTYRLCYDALAHFEADLHQHVHLENHVLFPRAIALERALS